MLTRLSQQSRSARFGGDFGTANARHNSDDRTPSTGNLAQGFGSSEPWQASNTIWGKGTIGSGIPNSKRDAARSQGGSAKHLQALAMADVRLGDDEDEFPLPNGSSALRSSSQANPWAAPGNGPWNPPDTTSPTLQSSGSTSPAHLRSSIPTAAQPTLAEIQNPYQQSRATQSTAFSRAPQKSSLNPSSGPFTFGRKPSFIYTDDKENAGQYGDNSYDYDHSVRTLKGEFAPPNFLATNGSMSRDGSMPPSRVSESGLNGAGIPYGSSGWGSIGGHTPTSSIHSQRPSFSGPSVSFPPPTNQARYVDSAAHSDGELSDKLAAFGLSENNSTTTSLPGGLAPSYSPNPPNPTTQAFPHSGTSPLWETINGTKGPGSHERYASQPFWDQGYFKPHAGERDSISPAGSDYRRGYNSPKFYHHAGTPPSGPDQIYRPSSRGQRIPQGPTEMDRRLQSMFAQQQAAYLYGAPFQGQYRPQSYEYAPSNFRQPNVPYGYPVAMPPYAPAQMIPTRPKDQDVGLGVRSPLLEEFRSNSKSNKRYDLKVSSEMLKLVCPS